MQKGFAQLLLLLLVILVAIFGGWYFYQNNTKGNKSAIKKEPSIPKVSPVSNLKDYTNQDLGFSLQYLKDLTVKIDSEVDLNQRGGNDFRKNFKSYVGYEPGNFLGAVAVLEQGGSFDNNPFSVWVFDNPNNLTEDAWFDKYWYYPYLWGVFDRMSKEHVTPNTEATISGQITKYKIVSYQPNSPKYIYVLKDGKMYLLRVIGKSGEEILTSFKLSQNYSCPENGWENCMPTVLENGQKDTRECSKEALDWKKKNCSNFQGAAH